MGALERGLNVISALAVQGPIGIEPLAATVGMPRSTMYRYLSSLRSQGFAAEDEGSWLAGPLLARVAHQLDLGTAIVWMAGGVLRSLSAASAATAFLCVRRESGVEIADVAPGPPRSSPSLADGRGRQHARAAAECALRDVGRDGVHARDDGAVVLECSGGYGHPTAWRLGVVPLRLRDDPVGALGIAAATQRPADAPSFDEALMLLAARATEVERAVSGRVEG